MIIFGGWGFLVIPVALLAMVGSVAACEALQVPEPFNLYLMGVVTTWAVWSFGNWLNDSLNDKVVVDPVTNKERVIRKRHTLFYIPVQYYAAFIAAPLAIMVIDDVRSGQLTQQSISAAFQHWREQHAGEKHSEAPASPSIVTPARAQDATPEPSTPRAPSGRIGVFFTAIEPVGYAAGKPSGCILQTRIENRSKFHLNKLTLRLDSAGWRFEFDEMSANTYFENVKFRIDRQRQDTCAGQVDYLIQNVRSISVFDCTIPNMAEGDCQDLVSVQAAFSPNARDRVASLEQATGDRQLAPIRPALIAANLDQSNFKRFDPGRMGAYLRAMETVVRTDADGWMRNRYITGSMRNVSLVAQGQNNLGSMGLRGEYDFFNGKNQASGWVIIRFSNTVAPCLIYWDFQDECRNINLPAVEE